uniref:Putative membrane protein n=1 Tax=uncultured bacterium CSLC3 TaxID=1091572 RepID=G4WVU1_9BACT|nr:putative membrane protein [uncultured bacterium CSLC3]
MKVVLITLLATFAIQLGYFLWKVAAVSLPRIGEVALPRVIHGFLKNGKWLLGLIATTIGWLLFIKATDLGEISLVQPLMSIGDLFLVILAVAFLHERLLRLEWVGLAVTVAGATILSLEAEVVKPFAIDWYRLAAILALATAAWAGLCSAGMRSQRPETPLAVAVGIAFGAGALLTKLMTAYITLNGQHLESAAFVLNPVLPFMVAANVAGLALLQVAFQRGRAAVIIPVQISVANGLVVLAGALVFGETISMLRLVSIGLIIAGTGLLQFRTHVQTQSAAG